MSAPGKRSKDDAKVTDMLIACATAKLEKRSANKELENVICRFVDISNEFGLPSKIIDSISADLYSRLNANITDENKFMDSMKAAGEDNCAKLVAAYLQQRGVEAHYINPKDAGLLLSDEFGNAQVLPQSYENLKKLKDAPGISIFPGFFGYSLAGDVVTLPRGGSDITGSILAAAVDAELYEKLYRC